MWNSFPSQLFRCSFYLRSLIISHVFHDYSILNYVTSETSLAEEVDLSVIPDKSLQDKEKELMFSYKVRFI